MKKNLIAALFTLAFGLSATTLAIAADAPKSEEAKAPMYKAACPAPCSFSVKSHDKAEVAAICSCLPKVDRPRKWPRSSRSMPRAIIMAWS